MAEELQTCPWGHDCVSVNGGGLGTKFFVACECGVAGPRKSTREDAIAAWNRRAPAPEPMIPARIVREYREAEAAFWKSRTQANWNKVVRSEHIVDGAVYGVTMEALSLPGDGETQKGESDGE